MAFKLPENVQETTTTAGTGDLILGGAVADAFTFTSQLNAGDTTLYVVSDGVDLEAGLCIFQTSPSTKIQRSTVYFSTSGGAKVNWPSSGTRNVFCGLNGAVVQGFLEPGANGLLIRSGTNDYEYRTLQEQYGLTITNPAGVAGDPSFRASQDLLDRIAYLETQHGGPGDTGTYWAVTIGLDTLVATFNVVNFTGTAWAITRDTATPPSYPTGFTESHPSDNPTKTLLSTAPEVWRFYQYDSVGGVVLFNDADGNGSITVRTTYTNQTPTDVVFTDVTSANVNSTIESNAVTISGLTSQTTISVVNGEYRINSNAFTSANGVINNTDTVVRRVLSPATGSTSVVCTTNLGARVETWTVTTASDLVLSTFTATVDVDTIIANLVWGYSGTVAPAGWIIKEDDTTLPLSGDGDWESAEPETFTLSDNNIHKLTARVRDTAGNISNAITVTVTPPVSADKPVITSASVINPAAGSTSFTYSVSATGDTSVNAFYLIQYSDSTQPALGDGAWVDSGAVFPLSVSAIAATLPALVDTIVTIFVKSPTEISAGAWLFVDTTVLGGDQAANGDWLWVNSPTVPTYTGARTFASTGALTIDGSGGGVGGSLTTTGDDNPAISITGAYSSIEIINMEFPESNGTHISINGVNNCDITIRNCKFGLSNSNNSASDLFKGAISLNQCNASASNPVDIDILGNWFDGPDGCVIMEECDSAGSDHVTLRMRHNYISKMIRHNFTSGSLFVTNVFTGRFGSVYGDISENIYYEPTGQYYSQDLLNLATTYGVDAGTPFEVTRNRFWVSSVDQGSNAAIQLGDKSANRYNKVHENTFIDINTFGQFSSGHHHEFSNNKGYTSESFPAVGSGYAYQIYRQGVDPGDMHSCIMENNTFLHYYDDGSNLIQRGVYYPSNGRDSLGDYAPPNHGTLVEGNVAPTGYPSTNDIYHSEWANGVGKSQLFRNAWKQFSYAGANGLTPTISYDSPWVGDGGSSGFFASSVTSAAYGDGLDIDTVQVHDLLALLSGGVLPYAIESVTAGVNCAVTVNPTTGQATFTSGSSAGAFSYTFTAYDGNVNYANGSVTGTLVDPSASAVPHFDQESNSYISIDPTNPHENLARAGSSWIPATGISSPDGTYMQCSPYSGDIAVGDVETDSCELVYRCHFTNTGTGTYTVWIKGLALYLNPTAYNDLWVGFDNVVYPVGSPNRIKVSNSTDPITSADWFWDDGNLIAGGTAITITVSGAEEHDLHIWKKKGGFALGKIVIQDSTHGGSPPSGAGPAESNQNDY